MQEILNRLIESYRDDMVSDISRLIAKKSVNAEDAGAGAPFGRDIADCLGEALKISRELGFSTTNYDGYAGTADFGESGDGKKQIGVLAHLDVVPAGDGWSYPPFEGTVVGDRLYGRGSIDDKGPLVACLYAMKAIAESGLPIKNSARLIMGTDEEGGKSRGIKYYLTKEPQPWGGFSPDGNFPVIHGEKGILRYTVRQGWPSDSNFGSNYRANSGSNCESSAESGCSTRLISLKGGTKINVVPPAASAVFETDCPQIFDSRLAEFAKRDRISLRHDGDKVIIDVQGKGAHAMQPWEGESAAATLLEFLAPVQFEPRGAKEFLDKVAYFLADGPYGENMGIACQDSLSGKLSHSMGIVEADAAGGRASVDSRYPIHADSKMLIRTIQTTCAENGLTFELDQDRPCLYVPKKSSLVQSLWKDYCEVTGRSEEPFTFGGGTYCRAVENFLAYGPVFPGEKELAHEPNEYVEIPQLILTAKIYAQALYRLLNL